jgi:hypothetical protein
VNNVCGEREELCIFFLLFLLIVLSAPIRNTA